MDNTKDSYAAHRRRWMLGGVLGALWCVGAWCNNASADESATPSGASSERGVAAASEYPACAAGPRLSAVLYDSKSTDRSFAVFGAGPGQRPRSVRRGARIGAYQVASIEQGTVVLASAAQRCSVRLRRGGAASDQGVVAVSTVRRAMQARKAAVHAAANRARTEDLQARAD